MLKLVAVGGVEQGMEFPLVGAELAIGRGEQNRIFLSDASVSLTHARVFLEGDQAFVEDLGSSNGVLVGGKKIPPAEPYPLEGDDEITIGIYTFALKEVSDEQVEGTVMLGAADLPGVEESSEPGEGTSAVEVPLAEGLEAEAGGEAEMEATGVFEATGEAVAPVAEDLDRTVAIGAGRGAQIPRLIVIAGADAGREVPLAAEEITVGRGEENSLTLADSRASRRHARFLRKADGTVSVEDLGSANGTFVADEKVTTKDLAGGEDVVIGDTTLRFVEAGGAIAHDAVKEKPQPKPPSTGGKLLRPLPLAAAGALLALGLLLFLLPGPEEQPPREEGAVPAADAPSAPEAEVETHLAAARAFIEERSWSQAVDELNGILFLAPDHGLAMELKLRAEEEMGNRDALEMARAYALEENFEEAGALLGRIPGESSYFSEAGEEAEMIRRDHADTFLARARSYLQEKKFDEAAAEVGRALEIDGGHPDAEALLGEIEAGEKRARKAAAPKAPPKPKRATVESALSLYAAGRVDEATKALESARSVKDKEKSDLAAAYLTAVAGARQGYEEGMKKYEAGDFEGAVSSWKGTLVHNKKLPLKGKSHYETKIGEAIADELYRQGTELAKEGDQDGAVNKWAKALEVNPGHSKARAKLEEVGRKLYRDGYAMEDINREAAIEKWERILTLLPPESEYHKKAKAKLEQFQ